MQEILEPVENMTQVPAIQYQMPSPKEGISQATSIEQSRAVAEAQAAVVVAKMSPRSEQQAMQKMLLSCDRLSFALKAFYELPRGGEKVRGPSINIAQEMARCWGNIEANTKTLAIGKDATEIIATVWDKETNNRVSKHMIVRHVRHLKGGVEKPLNTTQEVYELTGSWESKLLRGLLLQQIPNDIREACYERCKQTIVRGDGAPLSERIKRAVAAFATKGVSREMLVEHFCVTPDKLSADQFIELTGLWNSLSEGVSVEELFGKAEIKSPTIQTPEPQTKTEKPPKKTQAQKDIEQGIIPDPKEVFKPKAPDIIPPTPAPIQHDEETGEVPFDFADDNDFNMKD